MPRVIIDVGSYDGGDALRLSREFPGATVVTVEADPARFALVRRALDGTAIKAVHAALQDREGEVEFYSTSIDGQPSAQGSLYRFTAAEAAKRAHILQSPQPIQVPGRRMDGFMRELGLDRIDLLHMDVQGAEFLVLKGMGTIRPEVIYLEVDAAYEGAPRSPDIHRLLGQLGYRLMADFVNDRLYALKRGGR